MKTSLFLWGLAVIAATAALVVAGRGPAPLANEETMTRSEKTENAYFAGGCFWCVEADFEKVPGVVEVVSGYTGGRTENPTYREVCSGATGHVEAVKVVYDPARVSYADLLNVFWKVVDPTDAGGQFVDRGSQYAPVIFYETEDQKRLAEQSRRSLDASGVFSKPVAVPVRKLDVFYPAEDYHQDYYSKQASRYQCYRAASGRDRFLEDAWEGKDVPVLTVPPEKTYSCPSPGEIKKRLSDMQYQVTQKEGTEPPFRNEYWDNKKPGLYVDVVSGEPLFASVHKFDSGTGWPSFTQPVEPDNVTTKTDNKLLMTRIEVRSRHGDSHLGHVFDDGPGPTGMRYCINSAALRFVPVEELEREGYGQYLHLFRE